MRKLVESLFISALILFNIMPINNEVFPYFLLSIIIFYLLELTYYPKFKYGFYILYIVLALRHSNFLYFIPLGIYFSYFFDKRLVYGFLLFIFSLSPTNILFSILALYMAYRTDKYQEFERISRKTRDRLIEDTIDLKKRNENLEVEREKNIQIAILTERNRISRSLHDSIGHLISSSILQIEALKIKNQNSTMVEDINILQNNLKMGMKDIRENIHKLHDDSLNLSIELESLREKYPSLAIKITEETKSNLSYEMKADILYVIKEALNNTLKHSNGHNFTIYLKEHPKFYAINLKDNGSFFDESCHKGMGLLSIKEIAEKYQGIFNYKFDNGFIIHLTLMKGDLYD